MSEIFKTVLILSLMGTILIIPLLIFKPVTSKKFPAIWQYIIWITVMFSMLIPVYKILPVEKDHISSQLSDHKNHYVIPIVPQSSEAIHSKNEQSQLPESNQEHSTPSSSPTHQNNAPKTTNTPGLEFFFNFSVPEYIAYIWFFGFCLFVITITLNYGLYLIKKRKNSVTLTDNTLSNSIKQELNIKRKIRIRMSPDVHSPMLVGIIFPIVYIPCRKISDENLRMIFLHELTHFKHKDLFFKWLSLFTNAIHWFNPFAYLLCMNLSEACEISCDMSVTRNMSDEEQKNYMKTILDLFE